MTDFIYLASQSPRRSQLLDQLGVRHELLLPDADEDSEGLEVAIKNEAPSAYVKRVTGLKLDAAMVRMKRRGLPSVRMAGADCWNFPLPRSGYLTEICRQVAAVISGCCLMVCHAGA